MEVGGQRHATATLRPGKKPGTHFTAGWVGTRAGLDECGKSRPHRDSIPGHSHLHIHVTLTRRTKEQSLGTFKRRNALSHIGGALSRKVLSHWF
jgi:hypothetical protein